MEQNADQVAKEQNQLSSAKDIESQLEGPRSSTVSFTFNTTNKIAAAMV